MSIANQLTTAIINYLKLKGHFVWRNNNIPVYDAKKRIYRRNNTFKGVSDIVGITKEGTPLFIEVKIGRDKQSEDQKYFESEVTKRNGIYIIAKTFEDVLSYGL